MLGALLALAVGATLGNPVVERVPLTKSTVSCSAASVGGLLETSVFTRATVVNIMGAAITSQCPSGQARFDGTFGFIAEPQFTNPVTNPEALDLWTLTNVTATANSTAAPDSNVTADTLQSTVNGGLAQSADVVATATKYTSSVWVKVAASTQAFDLVTYDVTGAANLQACAGLTATTTWQRFTCPSSAAATVAHNLAVRLYPGGSGGTGTIIAWGAQMEPLPFASSYIATTRNSDTLYVQNPLDGGDSQFCIASDFTPEAAASNTDWATPATTTGLWEMSSGTHNVANQAQLYVSSTGQPKVDVRDGAAGLKTWTATKPTGGKHRMTACLDVVAGTVLLYIDAVSVSLTTSGAGTGLWTAGSMPTRVYLGVLTSTSHNYGWTGNVVIARSNLLGTTL